MGKTPSDGLISTAERAISAILAQLEKDTGQLVEEICVHDFEITGYSDDREQWIREVKVRLKRLPGTRWG